MAKSLRYTGCWPPLDVLEKYPNWVLAIDEEGEPDQDETTIKPEDQQVFISNETGFTSATVTLANGMAASGVLTFVDGRIDAIDVFNGHDWWRVRGNNGQEDWTPFVETWLPEEQRRPAVSLSDSLLFPLRITSRLPGSDGRPVSFAVPLRPEKIGKVRRPWYKPW